MGEDPDGRLGRPLGDALLEPTEIYVKPIVELLRSEVDVRGLAHITSGGVNNLLRLAAPVGYEIDAPLPVPPIFDLIAERGNVSDEEMHEVFNMGCGFCRRRPRERRGPRPGDAARPLPRRRPDRPRHRRRRPRHPLTASIHAVQLADSATVERMRHRRRQPATTSRRGSATDMRSSRLRHG